jgi:hypothetical protein
MHGVISASSLAAYARSCSITRTWRSSRPVVCADAATSLERHLFSCSQCTDCRTGDAQRNAETIGEHLGSLCKNSSIDIASVMLMRTSAAAGPTCGAEPHDDDLQLKVYVQKLDPAGSLQGVSTPGLRRPSYTIGEIATLKVAVDLRIARIVWSDKGTACSCGFVTDLALSHADYTSLVGGRVALCEIPSSPVRQWAAMMTRDCGDLEHPTTQQHSTLPSRSK